MLDVTGVWILIFCLLLKINVLGRSTLDVRAIWVLLFYPLLKAIYNARSSPLRKIPGPFLAKFTDYYLILIDTAGMRTSHIHALHQRYGPTVRIGPNEVSFTSPVAVKQIYNRTGEFEKSAWYEAMSLPPIGVFSQRDRKKHADRRRLLGPAFSQAALNDIEPTIGTLVVKLLERISGSAAKGDPVDVLSMFRRLSLDTVGALFLGQSFDALERHEMPEFFEWMDNVFISRGIKYAFPIFFAIMQHLPLRTVQNMLQGPQRVANYGRNVFHKYVEENGREPKRRDLLTRFLIANKDARESKTQSSDGADDLAQDISISDEEMYTEIGNMIFAGTDTTSSTLTYLFWELAKNEDWQNRARKELNDMMKRGSTALNGQTLPTYSDLVDLPILDAVVNETLRLYPSAPASLPRTTPSGGRMIDEHFMPAKTIVSVQCYTTHRDRIAFPDKPDKWAPNRWLRNESNEQSLADQERVKDLYIPFSRGSRMCLGKNLAMMELKITTAALLMKTRFQVDRNFGDAGMAMVDHFLAVPQAGKCDLVFEKI